MPKVSTGGSTSRKPKPQPQPSARVLASKKGGNTARAQKTTSPAPVASAGKDDVLQGTTSGSGVKLTSKSVTVQSKRILKDKLSDQRAKSAAKIAANRKDDGGREANRVKFGINDRKRSGGATTAAGGGTPTRDGRRDAGGIPEKGSNDGGRLAGSFRDRDIVGSDNTIDEFDGTQFAGGGNEGGGGGGSGSSLAGRESVGLADVKQGQSLEDVVYGVKRRRGKVSKARGE